MPKSEVTAHQGSATSAARAPGASRAALQHLANFIDGRLTPPAGGSYLNNIDPATGAVHSLIPDSDDGDVAAAVEAARRAFPAWSATPAAQRSKILLRIAELIEENLDALARAESIDTGKPLKLARSLDIPRAASNFRFFATAILHTATEAHITDQAAINYTLRQPRGVAGLISPWNLPLYLLSWKIAPALATGNTAVAKPSELTPTTAFMLCELCVEAGLPPGVLNIVHGLGEKAGAAIVAHPDVPTISFTGGTETGAIISRVAAPMFKKLSLELGGKNPTIVFADAEMNDAVAGSVRAAFANQGEICLCGSRILVERGAYEAFVQAFLARTAQLRLGDPLDPDTDQGALISREHRDRVLTAVDAARAEGGEIICGGAIPANVPQRCRDGFFLEPTLITGLGAECRTNREEIFGPVVSIIPFDNEQQAVEAANCTPYGLSASIWTQNLPRAHRVAAEVAAGTIWINCWLLRDLRVPFGGMKSSGVGREGGEEALRFFTEPKNICIAMSQRS